MLISLLILLLFSNALTLRKDKSILFSNALTLRKSKSILLSNALTLRKDKSILFSRVVILGLMSTSFLAWNNLFFRPFAKGIGIYGGLFNVTTLTQSFNIFIFTISVIILILTAFFPRKVYIKEHSSLFNLYFYNKGQWLTFILVASLIFSLVVPSVFFSMPLLYAIIVNVIIKNAFHLVLSLFISNVNVIKWCYIFFRVMLVIPDMDWGLLMNINSPSVGTVSSGYRGDISASPTPLEAGSMYSHGGLVPNLSYSQVMHAKGVIFNSVIVLSSARSVVTVGAVLERCNLPDATLVLEQVYLDVRHPYNNDSVLSTKGYQGQGNSIHLSPAMQRLSDINTKR